MIASLHRQDVFTSGLSGPVDGGFRSACTPESSGNDAGNTGPQSLRQTSRGAALGPDSRSAHLSREMKEAQTALEAAQNEIVCLRADCETSQTRRKDAESETEDLEARLKSLETSSAIQKAGLETEIAALQHTVQARDNTAASILELLRPFAPAKMSQDPQELLSQLQILVTQHKTLLENAQGHTDPAAPQEKDSRGKGLEKKLRASQQVVADLQKEIELMKRENGEGPTSMAVALALAPKEAEIGKLQRQLYELELQAQNELGDMHEELLEMRQACHSMELALNESEAKCASMLTEKQQVEQQLQETAGELIDVERELHRQLPSFSPRKHLKSTHGKGIELHQLEAFAVGPDTPPAAHPSRATEDNLEAGHIVIAGGGLIAFENLRKDYDVMMQELVQRKMELAELNEDYERICHAFLKADEAKNGPILADLRRHGALMRHSVQD